VADKPKPEPFVPFMYQLDPALVRPKSARLERRGPREFFIVGKTRDGYAVENKLSGGVTFVMRGI
jgi:hypothetical protein